MKLTKSFDDYKKSDWLLKNADEDIKGEDYVYRIFKIKYLLEDLKKEKMTLVLPCEYTQNDDLENPLREIDFNFEGENHKLFNSMMSTYFSQSWSKKPIEDWDCFGVGDDSIRIKCKASLLFDRLMNIADSYYSLHYHMGYISYQDAVDIRKKLSTSDFEQYLDSGGFGLLRTVMTIKTDYEKEDEVRLLYIRSPQHDNIFPNINTVFGDINQYCSHIYDWRNVIDDYVFNPDNSSSNQEIIDLIGEYNSSNGLTKTLTGRIFQCLNLCYVSLKHKFRH